MPIAMAPKAPCGCMAVAADHRHAGLCQTQLRADDVTMPCSRLPIRYRRTPNSSQLRRRCRPAGGRPVGDRLVDVDGGDAVIFGRDRQVHPAQG